MNKKQWKQRAKAAEAEVDRLRDLIDPDVSFKDLEMKMRDGTMDLRMVLGDGTQPAMKFIAMLMWHAILGEEEPEPNEPPNYRATTLEWAVTPAGTGQTLRCGIEVIKPGGKSSHEIRLDLEAKVARLEARLDEFTDKEG